MTLDLALDGVKSGKDYAILESAPKSIVSTKERKFFVAPNVNIIKEEKDSRIILFSAPGATGKSALAYHIARTYNALLWDLAKERLGNHSLSGMLVETLGAEHFSDFATGLKTGKAVLVIDAFDEAEMVSGKHAVETLLDDLRPLAQDASSPSIFLFARTETAHAIAEYYEKNVSISQYEISFFDEESSENFIKEKLRDTGRPISRTTEACIREQFRIIGELLGNQESIESFIGYAPVLETLASAFDEENNTAKLLNSLEKSDNGTSIILKILEKLLLREQEKVVLGFKTKIQADYPEFTDWDVIYTPQEQMIRLVLKIFYGTADYSDYPISKLPNELLEPYFSSVEPLLEQHPFLQKRSQDCGLTCDFTGPAFRDYVLAHLMLSDIGEDFAAAYFSEHRSSSFFPSQMFFDFYVAFSKNTAKSHHFPYLYEAFKSRERADDMARLSVNGAGGETLAFFSLCNGEKPLVEVTIIVEETDKGFCFDQLSNVSIDVDADVYIGTTSREVKFSNSAIICRKLHWRAERVLLEAYDPGETLIVSEQDFETNNQAQTKFEIRVVGDQALKVSAPNLQRFFQLCDYRYDYNNVEDADITKFAHAMEIFLSRFRKHGKDAPGRHADFIDNIIVGKSPFKASVLDFLKESRIIYRDNKDPRQYKMDVDRLGSYGVNWGKLSQMDNQMFSAIFEHYLEWKNK